MSGNLPSWLAEKMGLDAPDAGQAISWRLETVWDWVPWVTLLVVLGSLLWVLFWYGKESAKPAKQWTGLLVMMRLFSLGLVLLLFAQLSLALQKTGLPTVLVLIDHSGSMAISDANQKQSDTTNAGIGESRLTIAKRFLLENDATVLKTLERRYNTEVYAIASNATPLGLNPESRKIEIEGITTSGNGTQATRLGTSVRQALWEHKGTPPVAVLVLSDGITTDGPLLSEAANAAGQKGIPFYLIGVGDANPIRDISLDDVVVEDVVFSGDIVSFSASVSSQGLEGKQSEIVLRETGQEEILAEQSITLGPNGQQQKITLTYQPPETKSYSFTIEVRPVKKELQTKNNKVVRQVTVRKEKIKALLAASSAGFEYRFLKQMLERDETVELKVFLADADPLYAKTDATALPLFPVRKDELFEYDVLILYDLDLKRLPHSVLDNIRAFVEEKGGGLVWISGEQFSVEQFREVAEIAPLLPFPQTSRSLAEETSDTGYRLRVSSLGKNSPCTHLGESPGENQRIWDSLPPLYWMLNIQKIKPTARVLLEHVSKTNERGHPLPIVLLHFVGAGKVQFHATDETYRWRFRKGDAYFARFWVQSLRYLARSKLLGGNRNIELKVNRKVYRTGEPIRVQVRFFDERLAPADEEGVQVVMEQSGRQRRRLTLRRSSFRRGLFEGTFAGASEGDVHLILVRPAIDKSRPMVDFSVIAPPGELERLELDTMELQKAAKRSRGKFYHAKEYDSSIAKRLLADLPEGNRVPFQELPPIPLWNRWWLLLILLGMLITEWILRKRLGML